MTGAESLLDRTLRLWLQGGWCMVPLALVALMIYVSAVNLLLYFRRHGRQKFTEDDCAAWVLHPERAGGDLEQIVRYTSQEATSLDDIQDRFAEVMAAKLPEVDRRLVWLNVLVAAAPLLGLLGTVLGMLKTFQAIATGGGKTADMIARGISEALITTEVGLLVALPGLMFIYLVRRRRNQYVALLTTLEKATLDHFKSILHGATRVFRPAGPAGPARLPQPPAPPDTAAPSPSPA
jgi:biopolymer transport protein ExbB